MSSCSSSENNVPDPVVGVLLRSAWQFEAQARGELREAKAAPESRDFVTHSRLSTARL